MREQFFYSILWVHKIAVGVAFLQIHLIILLALKTKVILLTFNKYDYVLMKGEDAIIGLIIKVYPHSDLYDVEFRLPLNNNKLIHISVRTLKGEDLIPCQISPTKAHRKKRKLKDSEVINNEPTV